MVSIQTDLSIPKDVTAVRVEILSFGALKFEQDYQVGPSGVRIPASLGVLAADDPDDPVTIRVIALKGATARILRQVTTAIPKDRVALLRMPVHWLCDDTVDTLGFNQYQNKCGDGQSCHLGRCEPDAVDHATLPTFKPELVFGGAKKPGQGGACFRTEQCFDAGYSVSVDASSCSFALAPGEGEFRTEGAPSERGLNVGVENLPGGDGICSAATGRCYIPLDNSERYGWYEKVGGGGTTGPVDAGPSVDDASVGRECLIEECISQFGDQGCCTPSGECGIQTADTCEPAAALRAERRIHLPPRICELLNLGEIAGVRVTETCPTKGENIPTCGPWSSVGESSDAPGDGGVEGFCGDGNVDPGEDCDEGDTVPGDGCSSTCQFEASDGTIQCGTAICSPANPVELPGQIPACCPADPDTCGLDFSSVGGPSCDEAHTPLMLEPSCDGQYSIGDGLFTVGCCAQGTCGVEVAGQCVTPQFGGATCGGSIGRCAVDGDCSAGQCCDPPSGACYAAPVQGCPAQCTPLYSEGFDFDPLGGAWSVMMDPLMPGTTSDVSAFWDGGSLGINPGRIGITSNGFADTSAGLTVQSVQIFTGGCLEPYFVSFESDITGVFSGAVMAHVEVVPAGPGESVTQFLTMDGRSRVQVDASIALAGSGSGYVLFKVFHQTPTAPFSWFIDDLRVEAGGGA